MVRESHNLAKAFETEQVGGLLSGLLGEENASDRSALWRIGSWGVASVGAVVLALYASQSSIGSRREQLAAADLARQAQQLQTAAKDSQNEARRLASAIETLNGDRDRLYARITVLEQGLDSVTGAIARQTAAAFAAPVATAPAPTEAKPPQNGQPAPMAAPAATIAPLASEKPKPELPASDQIAKSASSAPQAALTSPVASSSDPLTASKSMAGPADPAAAKSIEPAKPVPSTEPEVVASVAPAKDAEPDNASAAPVKLAIQRTEFGVDVGGANSIGGLRALWLGLLKSRSNAPLKALRPIIVIKEGSNGLGMQLRLVAGPLDDAAAAAKICAVLAENGRPCETTLFEGQRLVMKAEDSAVSTRPPGTKPAWRRRSSARPVTTIEEPPKAPAETPTLSLFGRR